MTGPWAFSEFRIGVREARMDKQAGQGSGAGDFERQVEAALEKIRPALQADGGDIELLEVIGRNARVRLVGACHG